MQLSFHAKNIFTTTKSPTQENFNTPAQMDDKNKWGTKQQASSHCLQVWTIRKPLRQVLTANYSYLSSQ
jgi:hypothetical protein